LITLIVLKFSLREKKLCSEAKVFEKVVDCWLMLAHEVPNSQKFNQPVARNWVVTFTKMFFGEKKQNNWGKMVLPI